MRIVERLLVRDEKGSIISILSYLIPFQDGNAQFCASCRCGVEFIADMENGGELPEVIPYGNTGQVW